MPLGLCEDTALSSRGLERSACQMVGGQWAYGTDTPFRGARLFLSPAINSPGWAKAVVCYLACQGSAACPWDCAEASGSATRAAEGRLRP